MNEEMKRRVIVKRIILGIVLSLIVVPICAFGQEKRGAQDGQSVRFTLPPPRILSWTNNKPVKCTAIASAALLEEALKPEDFKHKTLSVRVTKGTDKLMLWLEGETLTVQVGDQKPDRYQVSGHRNEWLVAIHYGGVMPAAYSISLDEKTGFAAWSLNEPMLLPASEYPYAQSVYLHCTN